MSLHVLIEDSSRSVWNLDNFKISLFIFRQRKAVAFSGTKDILSVYIKKNIYMEVFSGTKISWKCLHFVNRQCCNTV